MNAAPAFPCPNPTCQNPNPPGARFCAKCGYSFVASSAPPPQPPPPIRPAGFGNTSSSRSVDLPIAPQQAVAYLQSVLAAEKGAIVQSNGLAGTYSVKVKRWFTWPLSVQMTGSYNIQPIPTGSRLSLSLGFSVSSLVPVLLCYLICGFFIFVSFFVGLYAWWNFASKVPEEVVNKLLGGLSAAAPAFQQSAWPGSQANTPPGGFASAPNPPSGAFWQGQPGGAPNSWSQVADGPAAADKRSAVAGQLQKLQSLFEEGVLSYEEYEAKKRKIVAAA